MSSLQSPSLGPIKGTQRQQSIQQQTNHHRQTNRDHQTKRDHQANVSTASGNSANLKPKEHGAYAILAVPLTTALIVGGITATGACVAIAAIAGFLSNEPLLVMWGHRGRRALHASSAARKRLAILISITVISGSTALILGSPPVRVALLGCLAAASVGFAISLFGKHRSLAGQLWAVGGLSLPCVTILLAGGIGTWSALSFWAVWLIGFSSTTVAVRGVIASQKRQSRASLWMLLTLLSVTVALNAFGPFDLALATLPMLLMSWYLMLRPPSPKHLRRVGWTLVVGTVVTACLLIVRTTGL